MTTDTMTTLVRFRTGDGEYAVAIDHARGVRSAEGMLPLPSAQPGVVGLLPGDGDPLTVIATLGSGHNRVIVLEPPTGGAFGLLVEEVRGVVTVELGELGPPPAGQTGDLVSGVLNRPDDLVLLVDVGALARTVRL